MSYDVRLLIPMGQVMCVCSRCLNEHSRDEEDTVFEQNITSNLAPMWRKAGIYLSEWGYSKRPEDTAAVFIEPLETAVTAMRADPETYRALNPPNGWGDYEGALQFLEDLLSAAKANPEARIYVSY